MQSIKTRKKEKGRTRTFSFQSCLCLRAEAGCCQLRSAILIASTGWDCGHPDAVTTTLSSGFSLRSLGMTERTASHQASLQGQK